MDFRKRLLLGLMALALSVAGLQAALGYWSFRSSMDRDLQEDVRKYALMVSEAINLDSPSPTLNPNKLPIAKEYQGRFRLTQGENLIFEAGGRFPEGSGWIRAKKTLPQGYELEVAINQGQHHKALEQYLRTSWISLLISLLLAFGLAILLRSYLLKPMKKLEAATQTLARERFPSLIPVEGKDELGGLIQSFNQMVERIHAALERERSFTRYASHELRTPLTTLSAYISGAQQGLVSSSEALDVAERNLERIQRTLSGLLELARGPGELSLVVLPELIQNVVKDYPDPEQSRIRLSLENAVFQAPPEALQGAIRNLLENALRYSEGPVCLQTQGGSSLRITVRDYGRGVPEAALARLSEPFFRLSSEVRGTGLGLAYTRQVAESLGGRLELRNHPQGGLEATLVLPGGNHA